MPYSDAASTIAGYITAGGSSDKYGDNVNIDRPGSYRRDRSRSSLVSSTHPVDQASLVWCLHRVDSARQRATFSIERKIVNAGVRGEGNRHEGRPSRVGQSGVPFSTLGIASETLGSLLVATASL